MNRLGLRASLDGSLNGSSLDILLYLVDIDPFQDLNGVDMSRYLSDGGTNGVGAVIVPVAILTRLKLSEKTVAVRGLTGA